MKKHTILFLAANPTGTSPLALGEEARAIQAELERSGYRDCFELETRWAAQPLDLLRELRKLKPTVVHFSGHGSSLPAGTGRTPRRDARDVIGGSGLDGDGPQRGLFFQGLDGRAQVVTAQALHDAFGAAGSSVKLVVLSACHSDEQAEALRAHVDCVVGMSGSIGDAAARSFAIGFYGGLGEREPVAAAFRQGCAAIRLEGLPDGIGWFDPVLARHAIAFAGPIDRLAVTSLDRVAVRAVVTAWRDGAELDVERDVARAVRSCAGSTTSASRSARSWDGPSTWLPTARARPTSDERPLRRRPSGIASRHGIQGGRLPTCA